MAFLLKHIIYHFVESPLKVVAGIQNQVTTEQEAATFECQLSKPKCNVKWYKNGQEIKPSDKHQVQVEGDKYKMTIVRCRKEDLGKYTVKCGGVESSAQLTVKSKEIVRSSENCNSVMMEALYCILHIKNFHML